MQIAEILSCALIAATSFGCSSSKGAAVVDAGSSSSAILPVPVGGGLGVCEPVCPRACDGDSDCSTDLGELCCSYGASKVCQFAAYCPIFCASDSACQTAFGQACVVTSLTSGAPAACADVDAGLRFCQTSTDCGGGSQTCCTNYDRPICTELTECPLPCARDSQCNADHGELCCTTVQALEPDLRATGLCLDPAVQPCPKACTASSECASLTATPLCCDGFCAATCPTTCTQDTDCRGAICCKSPSLSVAVPPVLFAVAPGCSGSVTAPTCADCFDEFRACTCPGCSPAAHGVCSGTPIACGDLSVVAPDGGVAPCALQPGCSSPHAPVGPISPPPQAFDGGLLTVGGDPFSPP